MKKQVLAVLGVLALGGAALAVAQAPGAAGRARRARAAGNVEMVKERLGLTQAQADELEKLRSQARRAAIQRRADEQLARLDLEELMKAETLDEKAIAAQIERLTKLHGAALKARVDERLAMRKILTPEQLQKLKQLRAERPGREGRQLRLWDRPERRPSIDDGQAPEHDGDRPLAGRF
jgi:Spy/CpxP family protein refolding chaperone